MTNPTLMLENGRSLYREDGVTPFDLETPILELLLESGASFLLEDGLTPLCLES